jgi:hypothetical protein
MHTTAENLSQSNHSQGSWEWCATCEHFLPRHTCEWKVLVAIVVGAGVMSVGSVLATLATL